MSGYMFRPPFRQNASFSQSIRLSVSVFVTECFSIMARQLSVRLSLCRAVNKMVWETKRTCINLLLWCLFISGNRFDIFIGIRSSICIEFEMWSQRDYFPLPNLSRALMSNAHRWLNIRRWCALSFNYRQLFNLFCHLSFLFLFQK